VALAYIATIDIPQRFKNSKAVGPILGLTPKLKESGVLDASRCAVMA
jgi:transposase